jgi:hypothetical protein
MSATSPPKTPPTNERMQIAVLGSRADADLVERVAKMFEAPDAHADKAIFSSEVYLPSCPFEKGQEWFNELKRVHNIETPADLDQLGIAPPSEGAEIKCATVKRIFMDEAGAPS